MIPTLATIFLVALAVCVAPGFFWTALLVPTRDFYTRIAFSAALSFALVPPVAVLLSKVLGSGVTLAVSVAAPSLVFLSGLIATISFREMKPAKESPVCSAPGPLNSYALAALVPALALAVLTVFGAVPASSMLAVAPLVLAAGAAQVLGKRERYVLPVGETSGEERWKWTRRAIPPVVFVLVLVRYYLGVVLHDWPFLRGGDLYSHAVMANRMMEEGEILPYLVYPPGFHTLTATISRLTGLDPLEVFPLLIPALMALPSLALYALATRLWGWGYGVAAAAVSGLVLGSVYGYFDDAMYPNVTSADFLLPMAVCALVVLYAAPTARSVLLFALLGSSVVFYHPVGSLYAAALFALVGVAFLPYLLVKRRAAGLALLGGFALLGALAVAYAWETYDLPGVARGVFGPRDFAASSGVGGDAVAMAVGTQAPLAPEHFLVTVTSPILWFGLLGAVLLLFAIKSETADLLARATVISWAAILFVGSRTSLSGFPERFERDLGVPLSLLAVFALGAVASSLFEARSPLKLTLAAVSTLLALSLFGGQVFQNFASAAEPPEKFLMTEGISEAGEWLKENNSGGNIIVGPHQNQVPSRAMLAMGDYSALQSFTPQRILYDRDLPPQGPEPMWDVLRVVYYPETERAAEILTEYDIRYIVFYKRFDPDTTWGSEPPRDWWGDLENRPDLYEKSFENGDVVIFEPR